MAPPPQKKEKCPQLEIFTGEQKVNLEKVNNGH